ncbi:heavy metal-associated isoprenylated plant protein 47-like [Fagus crenata]|uniref:HMA domain-containing protein n=1 Tax=Fagus sylvatica TaxID=28930 RepID=A0A2N9FIW2_FAGSY
MKQKIIIKVQMTCDKCRTKAMKIAATTDGVNSVAIEGSDKDQLVVIGEGVDSANLTCSLRKKLCHATLLSVEEVKEKKPEEKPKPPAENPKPNCICCPQIPVCYQYPPFPMSCEAVYDPSPGCIIM